MANSTSYQCTSHVSLLESDLPLRRQVVSARRARAVSRQAGTDDTARPSGIDIIESHAPSRAIERRRRRAGERYGSDARLEQSPTRKCI